jgi:hypothetical protein
MGKLSVHGPLHPSPASAGDRRRDRRPTPVSFPLRIGAQPARHPATPSLCARRAARPHGAGLHLGPERVGRRQQLLRRRRSGRHQELEGVPVRVPRRVELHHRRQATGVAVGDGAVGPDLRVLELEHARARGAGGGRGRRAGLCGDPALVRCLGRDRRRCGVGRHARRGAHVPLQQPRRAARAGARRRRLLPGAGAGAGRDEVDPRRRRHDRLRVPGQAAAGVHRAAGLRRRLPARGSRPAAPDASGRCSRRAPRWSSAAAGGCCWCRCGRSPTGR